MPTESTTTIPTARIHKPLVEEILTLRCGRKLAYCEYGVPDGTPVVFFSGAGFGRAYVPTPYPNLLANHGVRFVAVDRPGYGNSDFHPNRTYQDWAHDVNELLDKLRIPEARFLAHSAGTSHLAAVCAIIPEKVTAVTLVCPVAPIVGKAPDDRPVEPWSRAVGRFFLLYLGGLLDKLFGAVFRKWQENPSSYVQDTRQQIVAKPDIAFMKAHPSFFGPDGDYAAAFGAAVHEPHGVQAMLQDMFHLNNNAWGFSYAQLQRTTSNIEVWYGGADDTAPHGKWICDQLGIAGNCVSAAGHGLIHTEFEAILTALLTA